MRLKTDYAYFPIEKYYNKYIFWADIPYIFFDENSLYKSLLSCCLWEMKHSVQLI